MTSIAATSLPRHIRLSLTGGLLTLLIVGPMALLWMLFGRAPHPTPTGPGPVVSTSSKASPTLSPSKTPTPTPTGTSFTDNFAGRSTLQEADSMKDSTSKTWWLNSGGLFYSRGGYAQTVQGALPLASRWQMEYATSNAVDTDSGLHPQNIFRLVTRSKFRQLTQQAYFRVDADRLSNSPNRNASNGLLLFNRYQDGDNLYYTGLRVDGYAVIKKKYKGTYYTMAEQRVFPGDYNHDTNPDLLPKHTWIGLRSVVTTGADGIVDVQLWSDMGQSGNWQKVVEATDDGHSYGGSAITASGFGGIRTDFMDVSFRQYTITGQPN